MKSFSAKFTSLLLAAAGVYYLLYLGEGLAVHPFINVSNDFFVVLVIYLVCLIISPFMTLAIYRGGRWAKFLFGMFFVVLTSGSLYLLLPFFEVVTNAAVACAASAFFPVMAYTSYHGVKYIKNPACLDCASALSNRGFRIKTVNRKVFLKAAFSGFLCDTYKILGYILLIYLPAQVIGGYNGLGMSILTSDNLSLTIICTLCTLVLVFGAAGMMLGRAVSGSIIYKEV